VTNIERLFAELSGNFTQLDPRVFVAELGGLLEGLATNTLDLTSKWHIWCLGNSHPTQKLWHAMDTKHPKLFRSPARPQTKEFSFEPSLRNVALHVNSSHLLC
jgi:hypothetical protein